MTPSLNEGTLSPCPARRPGYADEPFIDFAVSPAFRAAFAELGLTAPLPDGYPVDPPRRFEPLPLLDLNEQEWRERGPELLVLVGWAQLAADTWPSEEWEYHVPGTLKPGKEPPSPPKGAVRPPKPRQPDTPPEPPAPQWRPL